MAKVVPAFHMIIPSELLHRHDTHDGAWSLVGNAQFETRMIHLTSMIQAQPGKRSLHEPGSYSRREVPHRSCPCWTNMKVGWLFSTKMTLQGNISSPGNLPLIFLRLSILHKFVVNTHERAASKWSKFPCSLAHIASFS